MRRSLRSATAWVVVCLLCAGLVPRAAADSTASHDLDRIQALKALQLTLNSEGAQGKRLRLEAHARASIDSLRRGRSPAPFLQRRPATRDGLAAAERAPADAATPERDALHPRADRTAPRAATASTPANFRANARAGDGPGSGQCETSIAAAGSHVLVAWNDAEGFAGGTQAPHLLGWAISTDGGATFADGGAPPAPSYWPNWAWVSDPSVAVNEKSGTFYLCGLVTPTTATSGIGVVRGTPAPGGIAWDTPLSAVTVSRFTNFLDKQWITADSLTGNVYVAYANFFTGGNRIEFVRSTDGGTTWSTPRVMNPPAANGRVQGARPVVGPDGEVHVTWKEIGTGIHDYIRIRTSRDGGATFGPEVTVASFIDNFGTGAPGFNRERAVSFPSIAVDRTRGPHRGRIHVAWHESFDFYDDPMATGAAVHELEASATGLAAMATATPFVPGDVLRGTLAAGDEDWFAFTAEAGDHLIAWCDSIPKPLYTMRILCADGVTRLAMAGDLKAPAGGQAFVAWTAPAAGTYYLRMAWTSVAGSQAGGYRVLTGKAVAGAERGRDQRDVFAAWSDDGVAWSAPVRVNDDAPLHDGWLPEVAVGADGAPYVAWYDWRDAADACAGRSHVYVARSEDGGATWTPNRRLTGAASDWSAAASTIAPNQGDYIHAFAGGDRVRFAWADVREGDPDTYVAALDTRVSIASAVTDPVVAAGATMKIDVALANANALFAAPVRLMVTDERGWTMPAPETVMVRAAGETAAVLHVWVPPDADGTTNAITVRAVHASGIAAGAASFEVTATGTVTVGPAAGGLALAPATPNPAAGAVQMAFTLPRAMAVRLEIFGPRGERVRTLVSERLPAGLHQRVWDGLDDAGRPAAAGPLFVRLRADHESIVKRFTRLR